MLLCPDPLWNTTLTWNTTNPNLTRCLQSLLISGLSAQLVITFPVWVCFIYNSYRKRTGLNIRPRGGNWGLILLTARLICYILILATSALDIGLKRDLYQSDVAEAGFLISACTVAVIMEVAMLCCHVHTSWLSTLFWFLLTLLTVPQIKMAAESLSMDTEDDILQPLLHIIRWLFILCGSILQCWANTSVLPPDLPEETACSAVSFVFFSWMTGLVWRGWRRPLLLTDIPDTDSCVQVSANADLLQKAASDSLERRGRLSLWRILAQPAFFGRYLLGMAMFYTGSALIFSSPPLLRLIIRFIDEGQEPAWRGYLYVALLFLSNVGHMLVNHHGLYQVCVVGDRMLVATTTAIYRKSLRLSSAARQKFTTGEITNLMSVDSNRIIETIPFSTDVFIAPLEIVICLVQLYMTVGLSMLAGLGVLLVCVPVNLWASKRGEEYLDKQLSAKDRRIKLMNEILTGIKVIKLYAWELPLMESIRKIRDTEINIIRYIAKLWALVNFTFISVPFLMTLATFVAYVYSSPDNQLSAEVIFVSLALFNLVRTPLTILPLAIMDSVKMFVSINRISEFLNADELDSHAVQEQEVDGDKYGVAVGPADKGNVVEVSEGVFTWEERGVSENMATLRNIKLTVRRGELVAVVGVVGAGKSSLLSALLGEMAALGGPVCLGPQGRRKAYVAQQAWIQNLTIRDNVLFGSECDEEWYKTVLNACCLDRDLQEMPAGDLTEIGENGLNLSGGQKMRVALARALYQQADLYLLDDPLAALDAHVGRDVFNAVLGPQGLLAQRGATRILVTHSVAVLKHVDRIVVMREGTTAETGTFPELLASQGPFAEFLRDHHPVEADTDRDPDRDAKGPPPSLQRLSRSLEEPVGDSFMHRLSSGLYGDAASVGRRRLGSPGQISYMHQQRRRRPRMLRSVSECDNGGAGNEERVEPLRRRQQPRVKDNPSDHIPELDTSPLIVAASPNLSMSIGDHSNGTPVGSRLTEDEELLTGQVKMKIYLKYFRAIGRVVFAGNLLMYFVSEALILGSSFVLYFWTDDEDREAPATRNHYMIIYSSLGLVQTVIFYAKELILFLACAEASRTIHASLLERILHKPMAFFDTIPTGRILNRFSSDIDNVDQTIPFQLDDVLNCVAELSGIIILIAYSTPLFLLFLGPVALLYWLIQQFYIGSSRQIRRLDSITKSPMFSHFCETIAGAATIRAYGATQRFVMESEELLTRSNRCRWAFFNSNRWLGIRIESLGNLIILVAAALAVGSRGLISAGLAGLSISYSLMSTGTLNWMVRNICALETNAIGLERIFEYAEREEEAAWHRPEDDDLPYNWPARADLRLSDVSVRYRSGLQPVLRHLTFAVRHGEKIGICGRTGAGKSSLSLLLFRLVEQDEDGGGAILLDGVDLRRIGLQTLRSRLTIIPQEPVLFSSTLRFNLDPGSLHTDEQLLRTLQLAGLPQLATDPALLDQEVQERGENFSVGQRQLICLGRALLRSSKLLILDEATAAVDIETDQLVQKTIREQFRDCTVLTIAHRLNTIMDNDRVLVLEKGELKELDTPARLLANTNSIFYSLAKESGLV